jgi:hypothetical protein
MAGAWGSIYLDSSKVAGQIRPGVLLLYPSGTFSRSGGAIGLLSTTEIAVGAGVCAQTDECSGI